MPIARFPGLPDINYTLLDRMETTLKTERLLPLRVDLNPTEAMAANAVCLPLLRLFRSLGQDGSISIFGSVFTALAPKSAEALFSALSRSSLAFDGFHIYSCNKEASKSGSFIVSYTTPVPMPDAVPPPAWTASATPVPMHVIGLDDQITESIALSQVETIRACSTPLCVSDVFAGKVSADDAKAGLQRAREAAALRPVPKVPVFEDAPSIAACMIPAPSSLVPATNPREPRLVPSFLLDDADKLTKVFAGMGIAVQWTPIEEWDAESDKYDSDDGDGREDTDSDQGGCCRG